MARIRVSLTTFVIITHVVLVTAALAVVWSVWAASNAGSVARLIKVVCFFELPYLMCKILAPGFGQP